MKLVIILGTRPEVIKLAPFIHECIKRSVTFEIINTQQHYDTNMMESFLDELNIPKPNYSLGVGSGSHAYQTASMLNKIETILKSDSYTHVIVQGDTNSTLAGALTASKLGIKVAHLEAGLLSYDKNMPEEINRLVVDSIADYLFAPTEETCKSLISRVVDKKTVFFTGNTTYDSILNNVNRIKSSHPLNNQSYFLLTLHRPSNVDDKDNLLSIFSTMTEIIKEYQVKIFFSVHPRTQVKIKEYKIKLDDNLIQAEPLSYFEFLNFEKNAEIILTDSGGIQEEACILRVPCVTIRDNTERPETISVGSNKLAGNKREGILSAVRDMMQVPKDWTIPYGKGDSASIMLDLLLKKTT